MTELEDLVNAVTNNPGEQAPADMLTDELMDRCNLSPSEARAQVARLRSDAQEAREVTEAAKLLAFGSDCRTQIRAAAFASLRLTHGVFQTIIVAGGGWPEVRWSNARHRPNEDGIR